MSTRSSPRRKLLLILFLAVALRLGFSIGVMRGALHVRPQDQVTDGYNQIAENLDAGRGYREFANLPPTVERPPAYPLFLVGCFRLFGVRYLWVQVVQAFLGALGCWILYRFGRWALSEDAGLAAALLFAVYPNAIEYSSRLYTENIYFPIFLGFGFLLCRATIERSAWRGLAAGALWGLSLLTRGTLLAFPVVLPVILALSRVHRVRPLRWLVWAAPALAGAAIVVAPWVARNEALTGRFIPVSTWGWAPFYHGLQCSKRMLHWDDLLHVDQQAAAQRERIILDRLYGGDRTRAYASAREYVRHEEVARSLVLAEIKGDPLGTAARAVAGVPFTWFTTYGRRMRVASLLIHLPLAVLFVVGVLGMAKRRPDALARCWPALGMIVFVNLFQALVYPHVRYMSPAISLSFVFAALPLADWAARRRA